MENTEDQVEETIEAGDTGEEETPTEAEEETVIDADEAEDEDENE